MAKTGAIAIPTMVSFSSSFDISENITPDIAGVKKGQRVQLLITYEVIEKTKSYTVLRANTISLQPLRRTF